MERTYDIKTDILNLELRFGLQGTLDTSEFTKEQLRHYRAWLWQGIGSGYADGMAEMTGTGL